jgi:hypothetical protein
MRDGAMFPLTLQSFMLNLLIPSKLKIAVWLAFNLVKVELARFIFAIIETFANPVGGNVAKKWIFPELPTYIFSINASPPKITAILEIPEHLLSSIVTFRSEVVV